MTHPSVTEAAPAEPMASALSLKGYRLARLWSRWTGRGARVPVTDSGVATQLSSRLEEAATLWTSHLATSQHQMRDATSQLLQGFAQILQELDAIVDADGGAHHGTVLGQPNTGTLDRRAAVLSECESSLRGLISNFQVFVQSREKVMQSVQGLTQSSANLSTMAEEVDKLARTTNLLSLNAAIEAARAGPSGRGFAVVANEVRRLSTESGDTGRRIAEHVHGFGERLQRALKESAQHNEQDGQLIAASEQTINQVVGQVDGAVSQLNQRAAELRARGEAVRAQVEQLMIAFQFQDRVHQIIDQVKASIAAGVQRLRASLASGVSPDPAEWVALLSDGYTTAEQRALLDVSSPQTQPPAGAAALAAAPVPHAATETTFF